MIGDDLRELDDLCKWLDLRVIFRKLFKIIVISHLPKKLRPLPTGPILAEGTPGRGWMERRVKGEFSGFRGRVARQRSAKPFTAVRIRSKPQKNLLLR
jgi:hypothetical protein